MSECDKTKIVGYIEQSPEQIECINHLKQLEIDVVKEVDSLILKSIFGPKGYVVDVDKRWMSIAKTHIQQGFMAAVRAVARPKGD